MSGCKTRRGWGPHEQAHVIYLDAAPSWRYIEKIGPHDLMITDPDWTASLIADAASSPMQ